MLSTIPSFCKGAIMLCRRNVLITAITQKLTNGFIYIHSYCQNAALVAKTAQLYNTVTT
jgi:hypothetical protein